MKSNLARHRMALAAICGIGLTAGIATFRAQADQWDKKTILTIDQPIQVSDRLLEPGTYVLKLAESQADRHIVQIFTGDQRQIIDTVLAIPNYRLRPTGRSQFAFWETPPGAAKALRAWFYPGDNFGQEFRHPKNWMMLQTAQTTETARATETASAAVVEPQETQRATNETVVQEEKPAEEEHVEVAQNNPPPAPPAQEEAQPAQPVEQPMPQNLPKTASPYPAIGLGGLLSLGLYGVLRLKRCYSA